MTFETTPAPGTGETRTVDIDPAKVTHVSTIADPDYVAVYFIADNQLKWGREFVRGELAVVRVALGLSAAANEGAFVKGDHP